MPLIQPSPVEQLAEVFADADHPIARAVWRERPGHPVLFHGVYRDELLQLRGDDGAQAILQRHSDRLHLVETDNVGAVLDADTPEALQALRDRLQATL